MERKEEERKEDERKEEERKEVEVYHLFFFMLALPLLFPAFSNASVVISPPRDYITFENNASNFTFNCNGSGKYLLWTVDGYGTGSPSVRSKGIEIASYIQDGHSVSSQLSIPKTRANSNITVICTVMKYLRIPSSAESSEPVKLILQGKLAAPTDFEITLAGGILTILWMAPFSLEVSNPPSIFNYTLSNNVTNSVITIYPSKCEPSMHCNYSLDLRNSSVTSDEKLNTTILDYNGTVEFTLFAINGAGNGNAAMCNLELQRKTQTTNDDKGPPTAGIPSLYVPGSTNIKPTTEITSTFAVPVVVVAVLLLGILIVVVVVVVVVGVGVVQRGRRKKQELETAQQEPAIRPPAVTNDAKDISQFVSVQ
ncbi:hypothetical protein EMCRGX_G030432 [Ephydatia muelleri]